MSSANKIFILCLGMVGGIFLASPSSATLHNNRATVCTMLVVWILGVFVNNRLKNPLADLINIVFFLFYCIRGAMLLIWDLEGDISKLVENGNDISSAINYITISYSTILLSTIIFFKDQFNIINNLKNINRTRINAIVNICYVIILLNGILYYIQYNGLVISGFFGSLVAIVQTVFNSWQCFILIMPIFVFYYEEFRPHEIILALIIFGFYIINMTLIGNKSAGAQLILYLLFPILIKIRLVNKFNLRRYIPFTLLLAFLTWIVFLSGKFMRVFILNNYQLDVALRGISNFSEILIHFLYRISYLDFSVEKITNPKYAEVINLKYYMMSIVDKLTPGFDLFNVPFISRTIYYVHHNASTNTTVTNSEILTNFGESWQLFGWFSLIYYFVFIYALSLLHRCVLKCIGKGDYLYRVIVAVFFMQLVYYWIEGMGLDMFIVLHVIYTTFFLISVHFVAKMYQSFKSVNTKK